MFKWILLIIISVLAFYGIYLLFTFDYTEPKRARKPRAKRREPKPAADPQRGKPGDLIPDIKPQPKPERKTERRKPRKGEIEIVFPERKGKSKGR